MEELISTVPAKVLLVDDDAGIRSTFTRVLTSAGLDVESAQNASDAFAWLGRGGKADVILTDLVMPGATGLEFLRAIRLFDLDVPVIVITAHPSLDSAIATVQYGGHRYLVKPVSPDGLVEAARSAAAMHRLAVLKREALEFCDSTGWQLGDRASLEAHFDRALDQLWMAFQPIVNGRDRTVYGYEGLVRSSELTLNSPALLLSAAERLGRVRDLGRRVRLLMAESVSRAPQDALIFTNLHSIDLNDEDLYAPSAALSAHAPRVVLEITERSSLDRVKDVRACMTSLRGLGYRIAVDDLGAGYAGLSSFAQLEPNIVKLDISLIRDIDSSARKSNVVRSIISVCTGDLGMLVVCEGVETEGERDRLRELGADLYQGYLFGHPEREFLAPSYGHAPATTLAK